MQPFNLPAQDYQTLFEPDTLGKFTKIYINFYRGRRRAAILLRVPPILDTLLYLADPGYPTLKSRIYPVYMGKIVLLGYLIICRRKGHSFTIAPDKVIIRKPQIDTSTFTKVYSNKQLLVLENDTVDLIIPTVKYEATSYADHSKR